MIKWLKNIIFNKYRDYDCSECIYNYLDYDYDTGKREFRCKKKSKRRNPNRKACNEIKVKYGCYH